MIFGNEVFLKRLKIKLRKFLGKAVVWRYPIFIC